VQQDTLCPAAELKTLADVVNASAPSPSMKYHAINSRFGHDSFLHDFDVLGGLLRRHLTQGLETQLAAEEAHTTGLSAP
jgi:homoserine acetyltransferase